MKIKLIIFFVLITAIAFCQSQQFVGTWQGNLVMPENEIPIVFHIVKDTASNNLKASFDSPKQQAFNLTCNSVTINGDSLFLGMKILSGKYVGVINADKNKITGNWYQGGGRLALIVDKISAEGTVIKPKRPQTPKAPFPYLSEEVEYDNADKSIHFGATFTAPK